MNIRRLQDVCEIKPPEKERDNIIKNIKEISKDIKQLERIYQRKLEALAELKQSILQKAFTGQLT